MANQQQAHRDTNVAMTQYHVNRATPVMVSEYLALTGCLHTMKNAIDNVKHIINGIRFINSNQ